MSPQLYARDEIPAEFKWNLEAIYASSDLWEKDIAALQELLPTLGAYQGRFQEGPETIAEWFSLLEQAIYLVGKIRTYAHSHYAVDTTNQTAAAQNAQAMRVTAQLASTVSFAKPELLQIGADTLSEWSQTHPSLARYRHYLDQIVRQAAHIRSPEIESILGQLIDPFATATSTHAILANAELSFAPAIPGDPSMEPQPVAQGTYDALITHPDRSLRRSAYESYADAHLAFKNTMANCLITGVKQNVFLARARNFSSALEASVQEDFIPPEIFYQTIETFKQNLPIWHRYWEIRRRALGYDTLYPYDLQVPLGTENPSIPYHQAIEWILAGLAPLGPEYVETARRGLLEERWVDVYPNKGKMAGAFSSGAPGTSPLILMSYTDDIFSLSTLAHELGHSMHSYLSWQSQPILYAHYPIFIAEVASNLNQALVRHYLFATQDDPAFQIALIQEALANYYRYFFLMPTLARFELAIHQAVEQGQPLTADGMIDLMANLFAEGYGGKVAMDHDRVGITWAEFHTHLYYPFYVYQYTTGISAAHALAQRILQGGQEEVDAYLALLRTGGSQYPLDALQAAGVDMTSPEPIQSAFEDLAGLVERLGSLLGVA